MSSISSITLFMDEKQVREMAITIEKRLARSLYDTIKDRLGPNIPSVELEGLGKILNKLSVVPILRFSDLRPHELRPLLDLFMIGMNDYCFGLLCNDDWLIEIINKALDVENMFNTKVFFDGYIMPFYKLIVEEIEVIVYDDDAFDYVHDNLYTGIEDFYNEICSSCEELGNRRWAFRLSYSPSIDFLDLFGMW